MGVLSGLGDPSLPNQQLSTLHLSEALPGHLDPLHQQGWAGLGSDLFSPSIQGHQAGSLPTWCTRPGQTQDLVSIPQALVSLLPPTGAGNSGSQCQAEASELMW